MLAALQDALASGEVTAVAKAPRPPEASAGPLAQIGGTLLGGKGRRWLVVGGVLAAFGLGQLIDDAAPDDADTGAAIASGDLWAERGVPDELKDVHAKVMGGEGIDNNEISMLRRFARDNRGDPRPYLLMAHGFLNQHWRKDAVVRYRRAVEVDASALMHAPMLEDLLDIAEGDKYADLAVEAIAELYGTAALDAAKAAMDGRPRDSEEHARLGVLVERLEKLGAAGAAAK
jgi:hypothetical protein